MIDTQVYTGFNEWNEASASETTVPRGIVIAFWVLFSVEVFAYVVGWTIMEPLARKHRKEYLDGSSEPKEGKANRKHLMSENPS